MKSEQTSYIPESVSPAVKSVRLVLIAEGFFPELPGGLMRFYRYGRHLRDRGIDVHVFTIKRPHHAEDEIESGGISIHRLSSAGLSNRDDERRFLIGEAFRWQKENRVLPTVFQVMAGSGIKGAWKLWKARIGGVSTVYALTIVVDPAPVGLWQRWKFHFRGGIGLSPYRKFFALSHRMKELYVQRLRISPKRIDVVANGVELERFRPPTPEEKRALRAEFGIGEEKLIVLCVGALVERKRVDVILEAWPAVLRKIPNAFFLIVGAQGKRPSHDTAEMEWAFEEYGKRIQRLAEIEEVADSIRIEPEMGAVENAYRISDIFALPSRLEGMPNVLLEAMSSGLPSIVNGFDGIPHDGEEIGNEGEHFLRCDGGAEDWEQTLADLLTASDECKRLGSAARNWMEQHQRIEDVVDRLSDLYRDLAGVRN